MNKTSNQSTHKRLLGKILYVTHAKNEGDWLSIPHTHPNAELFYVISGQGQFYIQGKYIDISADELIIVNAHIEHTEISKNNCPLEYIVVGIEGLHFSGDNSFNDNYSVHNFQPYKEEILFYLKRLLVEISSHQSDKYSKQLINSLLEGMLIEMIRKTNTKLAVSTLKKTTKECTYIETYINQHFKEKIDLATLSKVSYLNKYYLVHAFKKYKGISPIHLLNKRRIQEAQLLLINTNHTINDIASIIGFSSSNYFTYVFKHEIGCAPNEYRKQHKRTDY